MDNFANNSTKTAFLDDGTLYDLFEIKKTRARKFQFKFFVSYIRNIYYLYCFNVSHVLVYLYISQLPPTRLTIAYHFCTEFFFSVHLKSDSVSLYKVCVCACYNLGSVAILILNNLGKIIKKKTWHDCWFFCSAYQWQLRNEVAMLLRVSFFYGFFLVNAMTHFT